MEESSTEIWYSPGKENIAAGLLSQFTIKGKQETTHMYSYTLKPMSELYNMD